VVQCQLSTTKKASLNDGEAFSFQPASRAADVYKIVLLKQRDKHRKKVLTFPIKSDMIFALTKLKIKKGLRLPCASLREVIAWRLF